MNNPFSKATKKKTKLRMALCGPSGSGKTYTALSIATKLGAKVAVIDSEHGSASKYDWFNFDVLELSNCAPQDYINAINGAVQFGYDVLVIDSLSHAWAGKNGVLEMVDAAAKRSQSQNSFTAWRDVTPQHNALVEAMLAANIHIIVTLRVKTDYVMEEVERNGRRIQSPRKVGLAPIQRDGLEYEFDIVGDLSLDNTLSISKTRCPDLHNAVIDKPGADFAAQLHGWLETGVEPHWALNGGGVRINDQMKRLGLAWADVAKAIEPGKPLLRLSDTTLNEDQVSIRLDEIAEGRKVQSHDERL